MTTTAPALENQTFTITEEIIVRASLDQTFASLLAQMGRLNETPDGAPLPMICYNPVSLPLSFTVALEGLVPGAPPAPPR